MRVLDGNHWKAGFLPYHQGNGDLAIRVQRWITLARVSGQYFVRPRDLKLVFAYLREVGIREVWRKIRSRSSERLRNEKFLSVGLGVTHVDGRDRRCIFVAYSHPRGLDELVLPPDAVAITDEEPRGTDELLHIDRSGDAGELSPELRRLAGWSPMAGITLDASAWTSGLAAAQRLIDTASDWSVVPPDSASDADDAPVSVTESGRSAGLFGYGNYAKTYVVPNIGRGTRLAKIHEIDPTQIPLARAGIEWSTNPEPDPGEVHDIYYVAGYHHTHAPLAIEALRRGAIAVVEKPLVTDSSQLEMLLSAMATKGGKLFACFHKRYSALNALARTDLNVRPGTPVDYHAIVYEVPLPPLHWYRWPNARSRLVSNGCHWIDHFLFLNDYANVIDCDLWESRDGTINCSAELETGATFSMVLTERGSERLGVRDYIELRSGDTTVTMGDSSRYRAESSSRVLRQQRVNKATAYARMYRRISMEIEKGAPGDTQKSVQVGCGLMLDLERMLGAK